MIHDTARWANAAVTAANSRGRRRPESAPGYRSEFQRDRDRIIHSASFRRLEYKTQVFISHEGDMFRTRLTHSLEVAQIARTIARALGVNEDLTETIALGHDLGHSPFGHAGQQVLNECMAAHGGFEHNLQSLRVVDELENRYPAFRGLNLLFETREGLLKHCSRANAAKLGDVGQRFLDGQRPSIEAQICDIADAIAYNHHDIDDGVRSGLLELEPLCTLEPFATFYARHEKEIDAATAEDRNARNPADARRTLLRHTVIRKMINFFVTDLIATSTERLAALAPAHPDEVRAQRDPVIAMSEPVQALHLELKRFLFANLYRHPRVLARMSIAEGLLKTLFDFYLANPRELPMRASSAERLPRAVTDYIAGMTDRYAMDEYERITGTYCNLPRPRPEPLSSPA